LGESIISNKNSLNYEYIDEKKITNLKWTPFRALQ
jgi:hypothetical protein